MDPSTNQDFAPIVIEVNSHQALYLPPYWFHTVVTMEPSLSINVWSNSNDYLLMEQVLKSPIPFEAEWPMETLLAVAKLYIDIIVETIKLSRTFVKAVVLPRYLFKLGQNKAKFC